QGDEHAHREAARRGEQQPPGGREREDGGGEERIGRQVGLEQAEGRHLAPERAVAAVSTLRPAPVRRAGIASARSENGTPPVLRPQERNSSLRRTRWNATHLSTRPTARCDIGSRPAGSVTRWTDATGPNTLDTPCILCILSIWTCPAISSSPR